MRIKMSKSQWEVIGKRAGWIKTAKITAEGLDKIVSNIDSILSSTVDMKDQIFQNMDSMVKIMDEMGRMEVYSFVKEKNIIIPMMTKLSRRSLTDEELSAYKKSLENIKRTIAEIKVHVRASSNRTIKKSEDGQSQTMPLDGVQRSPAANVEFEKKDTANKVETQSNESMVEIYKKFRDNGRANDKGVTEKDVDPEQLKIGIEVEMEHTTDKETAKRIALDHLAETNNIKSKYYTYLKEMEKKIEEEDKLG